MRLGIDLDGVLFDFNIAWVDVLKKAGYDLPLPSRDWPVEWNYHRAYGVPKDEEKRLWAEIHASGKFWLHCPEYPWSVDLAEFLDDLNHHGHEVYYITSRSGLNVKQQCEDALSALGVYNPTVLPVPKPENKLPIVKALGIKFFLDDKPETVVDIKTNYSKCHVAVFDQPWNRIEGMDSKIERLFPENAIERIGAIVNGR